MNLSRGFTLSAARGGSRVLLTVGRVQTPTLALVVARDLEIENFKPIPYTISKLSLNMIKGRLLRDGRPEDQLVLILRKAD
ncbi:DNA topoisomerase [Enterobacter kobei]|uniref:DNA topoisomerase n=1 Tax=Enterobacter kobei TaxID=208224 RepID=UPI00388E94EF